MTASSMPSRKVMMMKRSFDQPALAKSAHRNRSAEFVLWHACGHSSCAIGSSATQSFQYAEGCGRVP